MPKGAVRTADDAFRDELSGAGDEAHAALVGLRDLDVGDPVDRIAYVEIAQADQRRVGFIAGGTA